MAIPFRIGGNRLRRCNMLCETPRSREDELFRTQEHMQDFLDGESIDEVDCYPHADNEQTYKGS